MIILVDFENTHVSGLDGYEYLNDTDTLVMYYSDENSAVTKGMVDDLKKHNVHVSLVKLLKQHSNALDMYIASTTGMFLETGEKICIVSKDKGYAAVRDFWHSLRGAEILLGETIKECFLNSEKIDDVRIKLCKERAQKATLVDSFATMNTIPTRPTLSKGSQRRKKQNINFTLVSEPVSLIPNPLMMATPADQLAKQMQSAPANDEDNEITERDKSPVSDNLQKDARNRSNDRRTTDTSELRNSDDKTGRSNRRANTKTNSQDNRRRDSIKSDIGKEVISHGGYDGIGKVNEASRIENQKRIEAQDKPKAIIKTEPEKTAIIPRKEQKTALTKTEPKFDPNRMQYIYDPVSRSMKKVGAESTEEAAKKADTVTADFDSRVSSVPETDNSEKDSKDEDKVTSDTEASSISEEALNKEDIISEESLAEKEDVTSSAQDIGTEKGLLSQTTDEAQKKEDDDQVKVESAKETAMTTETSQQNTVSEVEADSSDKKEDVSEEKPAVRKTTEKKTEKKAGRKAGRPKKAANKEIAAATQSTEVDTVVKISETASDVVKTAGDAESTDDSVKTASTGKSAEETTQKSTGKRGRKPSSKNGEKKTTEKNKSASSRKKSAEVSKKDDTVSDSNPETGETNSSVADSDLTGVDYSSVTPEEAMNKYGLTANTLHTYYVRLMKAYGREQGRTLYDSSKKMLQEDIKRRKESKES